MGCAEEFLKICILPYPCSVLHRFLKALKMNMGDVAYIKKSNLSTKLVRLKERSFYDVVNMKFRIG